MVDQDHRQFAVIGGQADRIRTYLQEHYSQDMPLAEALALSRQSLLAGYEQPPAEESALEVGLLERPRVGRKFSSHVAGRRLHWRWRTTNNGLWASKHL